MEARLPARAPTSSESDGDEELLSSTGGGRRGAVRSSALRALENALSALKLQPDGERAVSSVFVFASLLKCDLTARLLQKPVVAEVY